MFINHSLNPAKRLLCGGTQRNTTKCLYTGTQLVIVVTGHSDKMLPEAHMRVYNCAKDHKMRLMQLFPLSLHSHSMRATHLFVWKVLQGCCQKTVQGNSFGTTEDAVPHWPRLDVCWPRLARNLTVEGFTGGKIRRHSLWSKGIDCLRFCAVQWAERLRWPGRWCSLQFYRCHHVVVRSLTSMKEARRKRFQSFTDWSASAP